MYIPRKNGDDIKKEVRMKKQKKIKPYEKTDLYSGAASANECTGLTATVPIDDAEAESYRELSGVRVTSEKTLKKKK